MKKLTDEASVKKLVKDWYAAHNAWSFSPVSNGMGVHGIPDRLGGVSLIVTQNMVGKRVAVLVAIESKRPGRRNEQDRGMSKHQKAVMDAIRAAGGLSICCDGYEDLAELDRELHALIGV